MAEFEYQPVDQLKYYPPSDFKDASRLRKHIGDMDPLGRKIVGVSEQIEGGETPDQDFYSENRDVIANYVRDIPKAIQALEEMVEWPDTKFKVEKVGKKVYQPSQQRKQLKKWVSQLSSRTRNISDAALIVQRFTERAQERADQPDLDDELDRDPEGPRTPSADPGSRSAQPNYGEHMSLDYKWMIGFLQQIEDMRDRALGERGYYNVDGPIHQTDDSFRSQENQKSFADLMRYIRGSLSYWKVNRKDYNHELKTYLDLRMELTKQLKFAELRKWQARNLEREPQTFEQAVQNFHNYLGQQRLVRTRMSCNDMIYYTCLRCSGGTKRVKEHTSSRDSYLKNKKNWQAIGAEIQCPQCGTEGVDIKEVKEGCGCALGAFPLDLAPGGVPGEETEEGKGIGWKIMCDSYPNFPTNTGVKKAKRTPKPYCECAGIPRFPHDRNIKNDVEAGRNPFNFFEKSVSATDLATDVEQHFIPIVPNDEASALGSKRLVVPGPETTGKIIWEPGKSGDFVAKFTASTDAFADAKTGDYLMLSASSSTRYQKSKDQHRDPKRGEPLDQAVGSTGRFKDHPLDGSYFIVKVLSPDAVLISIDALFNRRFAVKSNTSSAVPINLYQAVYNGGVMEMKKLSEIEGTEDEEDEEGETKKSLASQTEMVVVTEPDGTWYAMDPSVFTMPVRWALMKIDINEPVDAENRKWPRWKVEEARTFLGALYERLPDGVENLEELDGTVEALESEFEWVGGHETETRKSRTDLFKDAEAAEFFKEIASDIRKLESQIATQEAMPIMPGSDEDLSEKYNELSDIFTGQMDQLIKILTGVTKKAAIADVLREAEASQYERMERIRRGEIGPSDDLFVGALHALSRSDEVSDLARTAEKRFTNLSKFKSITGKNAVILLTDPETGEERQLETTDADAIQLLRAYNTFGAYAAKYEPGKDDNIPMGKFAEAKDVLVKHGLFTEEQWQRLMEEGWIADDIAPEKIVVQSPEETLPRFAILIPKIEDKVKRAMKVMDENPFVTNVSIVSRGQSDKFGGPPVDDYHLPDGREAVAVYFTLFMEPEKAAEVDDPKQEAQARARAYKETIKNSKHVLNMIKKSLGDSSDQDEGYGIDNQLVMDERGVAMEQVPAIWDQDLDSFNARKESISRQREEVFNYLLRTSQSDLIGIRLFPVSSDQAFINMQDRLSALNTLYQAIMGSELEHKERKDAYEANAQNIASMQDDRKTKVTQYRALGGKMKDLKGNLEALPDEVREKAVEIRNLEEEIETLNQRNRDIRESMGLTDDLLNALGHGKRYIVGEAQKGHFRSEVSLVPGIYQRILHNQKTVLEIVTKLRDKVFGHGNWGDTITEREVIDDTTATMVMDILSLRQSERERMVGELQSSLLKLMEMQMAVDPVKVKEIDDLRKRTTIPQFREFRMRAIENRIADLLDDIHQMEGLTDSETAEPDEIRDSFEEVRADYQVYQQRVEETKAELERFASAHKDVQEFVKWQEELAKQQQAVAEAHSTFELPKADDGEESEAERRVAELEGQNMHVRHFSDYYDRAKAQQRQLQTRRTKIADALRSKEIDPTEAKEAMEMIDLEIDEIDETHYLSALEAQYRFYRGLGVNDLEVSNAEFRRNLAAGPIGAARVVHENYKLMLAAARNNQDRLQEMLDQYNRELRRLMKNPNVQELFVMEKTGPEFHDDVFEQQQIDIQKANQKAQQHMAAGEEQEAQRQELLASDLKERFEYSQQALKMWREAKPFVINYLYLNDPSYKSVASDYLQENERYQQVSRAASQARDRFFRLRDSDDPSDQSEAARLESQLEQYKWQLDNAFPIKRLLDGESDLKPGFVKDKIDELEASIELVSEYYDLKSDLDVPEEKENKEERAAREAALEQARADRDEISNRGANFDSDEVKAYRAMLQNLEKSQKAMVDYRNQLLFLSARLTEAVSEDLDMWWAADNVSTAAYHDYMDEQLASEEALKYQEMIDKADLEIERLQNQPDRSEETAELWAQIDSLQKRRISLSKLVKLKSAGSDPGQEYDEEEFEDEENPSAVLQIIQNLGQQIERISGQLEEHYPDAQISRQVRRRGHALEKLEGLKKKARATMLRTSVEIMDAPRQEDVAEKEQAVRDAKEAVDAAEAERDQYADNPERPKYLKANQAYLQAKKELERRKVEYRQTKSKALPGGKSTPRDPIADLVELNDQIVKLQEQQREILDDPDRVDELPDIRREIDDLTEKLRQVSRVGNDPLREAYGDLYRLYRERDSFMGKDPLTEESLEELAETRDDLHLQQSQAARDGNRALEREIQDAIDKVDAEREKILTLSKYDGNIALDEYRASSNAVRRLRADRQVLQAAYNDARVIGASADPEQIKLEIGKINVKIGRHREVLRQWDRDVMVKSMSRDLEYDGLEETQSALEDIRYLTNKKNTLQTKLIGLSGLKAPDRARFYLREIAWLLCNDDDRDLYKPTPEHVGLGTGVENVMVPMTQKYEEYRKDFSPAKKTCNHGKAPNEGGVAYNPKFGMDRKKLRSRLEPADDDKLTEDERQDPSGNWLSAYSPKVPNTHLTKTLYRSKSMAEQIARENEQTGDNRPVPLIPYNRRDEFPADDLYAIGKKPKRAKDEEKKDEWVVTQDGKIYSLEEAKEVGFNRDDEDWIPSHVYQCPVKGIIQVSGRRCPQCGQNTIDRNGVKCANPDCGFVAEAAEMPNRACYVCGRELFDGNEDWPNRSESMSYQSKFEAGAPIRFMTAAEMQNIQDRAIIRELYGALMQTLHDFVSPIKAFVAPERITGQNRPARGRTPRFNSRKARAELNAEVRNLKDRGGSIWVQRPMFDANGAPVLDDDGNQKLQKEIHPRLKASYDRAKSFDAHTHLDDPTENDMEKMISPSRVARMKSGRSPRGAEKRKRFRRVKKGAGLQDSVIQPGDKVCISEVQDRILTGLTGIVRAVDPMTYEAIVEFDQNDRVADRRGRFYFHELELLEREVIQELGYLVESVLDEL